MFVREEFPFIIKTLPKHIFNHVKDEINKNDLTSYNDKLAGNIEKEYKIFCNEQFKLFIYNASKDLIDEFGKIQFPSNTIVNHKIFERSLKLEDVWVNFQAKHEYNPVHVHAGVFSYVIYIQIPYSLEDEDSFPNSINSNTKSNSRFCFYAADQQGKVRDLKLDIDKSWEGKMIIFPACLSHQVYPFYTSDDYRISVAGNINVGDINYAYF